jgi:hypothetical protein
MADTDDRNNEANLVPTITATDFEEVLKARLSEIIPEPKKQEVTRVVHEVVCLVSGTAATTLDLTWV